MRNEEHVLVPFQVSPLPAGPWLVFAPHADDETFGMGGSLYKASRQGIDTHVVVVTDGSLGGDTKDLVRVRNQEVTRATGILGVKSLECWSEKDRSLQPHDQLVAKIIDVIRHLSPASVFFPGPLELHPDHRATALAVWAALQQMTGSEQLPQAYSYEISVQNPINCLIDITREMPTKKVAMSAYASQNSQNDYPQLVLALDQARTFTLPAEVEYAEGFFRYKKGDLSQELFDVILRFIELYR